MNRSQALEAALNDNNVMEFCNKKISESDADEKRTWEFLKARHEVAVLVAQCTRHTIMDHG